MRRRVDAAREPRGDGKAGFAKLVRDPLGEFQPRARGAARADDRHGRQRQRVRLPAHRQQPRRVVDRLQPRRIAGLAERDERDPEPKRRGEFAFGVDARAHLHAACETAALRQRRQRLQGRPRAAEMIDQRPKGARADIGAADQAQPVDPRLIR